MRATLLVLLLALAPLAGCVDPAAPGTPPEPAGALPEDHFPIFTEPILIDAVRSGGEPVIAITPKGTLLVAAHPGWTHTRYPPSANLVTPASGQSYLWRSTDQGATWQPVGLPGANGVGPRGVGQGVSDPDFALDSKGRIYLTDLEALAAASVSWSDDDGQTWLMGNNLASTYGPIDRNWLATHGTDVYFMGNYFVAERVLKSTDGGLTWSEVGRSHCSGDFIVHEFADGTVAILVGCANGIDVSTDGGKTFERRMVPDTEPNSRAMTEPAVDAAGNVYTAWADEQGVWVAGTADLGLTWSTPVNVAAPLGGGTHVWPWVVAGDEGRVGVVWYGTPEEGGPTQASGDWFVHASVVTMAMTTPDVHTVQVTPTPVFKGAICQRGTTCQADPTPSGDRRMGDFFEAALDAEGHLNIAYSVALDDSISHAGFSRQTGGVALRSAVG